ncbi:MAG TPA: STAS domain-containing protein [Polyangium sp.]|nr:STAS domain-containing protein [Polyangium sp.]
MQRVIDAFREDLDATVVESCRRVLEAGNPFYARMPLPLMQAGVKRVLESVVHDMEAGSPQMVLAVLRAIGSQRSLDGAQIKDLLGGMEHGYITVSERMAVRFADDLEARLYWETWRAKLSYAGAIVCADAFLGLRQQQLQAQAEEIMELSARVLPLSRGVLLLPLVGRLDGPRAERIMEVLLGAVTEQSARVVLLDVTALPTVDEGVAMHIVRAASAVRLLGATAVLVGVRPSLAQAIVAGGIDLGGIVTLARLEDGLRYAGRG